MMRFINACPYHYPTFSDVTWASSHDDVIKWKHFPRHWPFVTSRSPPQRPLTRRFDVFFDLRLNKRLIKQSRRLWLETQSRSLWRHFNVTGSSFVWQIQLTTRKTSNLRIAALWAEITGHWWIPCTKGRRIPLVPPHHGRVIRKAFPCHNVIITRTKTFLLQILQSYVTRLLYVNVAYGYIIWRYNFLAAQIHEITSLRDEATHL